MNNKIYFLNIYDYWLYERKYIDAIIRVRKLIKVGRVKKERNVDEM